LDIFKLIVLLMLLPANIAAADTKQEIAHLLDFVANTPCIYERNGETYAGPEAWDHINRKYQYYQDKVKTAEDFITYSATKSKISGKNYKIRCPGSSVMNTNDWLLGELRRFRHAEQE